MPPQSACLARNVQFAEVEHCDVCADCRDRCLTLPLQFSLMNRAKLFHELGATTMFRRIQNRLIVLCLATLLVAAVPAETQAGQIWNSLFGCGPCTQTTYMPVYRPTTYYMPAVAAPSCAPCASSCAPCAPQTCQYMPSVVQSALYPPCAPTAMTTCRPACQTWTGYAAVTSYRPLFGTYQTRLVPYATYRPVYTPVVSYGYAAPCATCPTYSSCAPCASGGCGVPTYSSPAPASGCASCAASQVAPTSTYQSAPATNYAPQNPAPQRTFEEKVNKPAVEQDLKPIPQPETTKPSSLPTPSLPDPNNRTAVRKPIYSSVRIIPAASASAEQPPLQDDGLWRAVKE